MHAPIQNVLTLDQRPYQGLLSESLAAAQRAASLRRCLLKAVSDQQHNESPDALQMRDSWASDQKRPHREKPQQPEQPAKDRALSFWA